MTCSEGKSIKVFSITFFSLSHKKDKKHSINIDNEDENKYSGIYGFLKEVMTEWKVDLVESGHILKKF